LNKTLIFSAVITGVLLSSCTQNTVKPVTVKPAATIQSIMVSIIDPNIDFVWNSIATINTAQGTEERRPKTDKDWHEVKQHALAVLDGSKQLLLEDIKAAAPNANTSSHPVELSAADIEKAINSHRTDYVQRVENLQSALQQTIAAIDAKNVDELEKAGGIVDQACEQCHTQFWYPNDKRPN
jgi:cytochrome c556